MSDAAFVIIVAVLTVLFIGEPDLHDILLEKFKEYKECVSPK